jgi:Sec-independent protein secretion pathway component TatC
MFWFGLVSLDLFWVFHLSFGRSMEIHQSCLVWKEKNTQDFYCLLFFTFLLEYCLAILSLYPCLWTFATFTVSTVVKNQFSIDSYIGMVKTSVILRIIFWITHNYLFPDQVGLVTPEFLRKYWKYAVIIILIVAAIVTPQTLWVKLLCSDVVNIRS